MFTDVTLMSKTEHQTCKIVVTISLHILFPCSKYALVRRSRYKILAIEHAGDMLMQIVSYTKTKQCIWILIN
jgi:hypothetical protein